MRMSLEPASASSVDSSSTASRPNVVAAMNGDLLRDGRVLADRPTPLHPLGRPLAGDLQRPLPGRRAHRRDRQPAGVEGRQRDLEALALAAEPVLDGHPHLVEPGDAVLDALEPHERVAALDRDAGRVGLDDERADAAASAVVLGHGGHHDDELGDRRRWWSTASPRRAGRPSPSSVGVAVLPIRAGSDPTSGSVSRNARDRALRAAGQEALLLLVGAEHLTGSGTPIDWCADSSAPRLGCTEPASISALAVGGHRQPEAAVLPRDLHPERAERGQRGDVLVGDPGLALDPAAVERRRRPRAARRGTRRRARRRRRSPRGCGWIRSRSKWPR